MKGSLSVFHIPLTVGVFFLLRLLAENFVGTIIATRMGTTAESLICPELRPRLQHSRVDRLDSWINFTELSRDCGIFPHINDIPSTTRCHRVLHV